MNSSPFTSPLLVSESTLAGSVLIPALFEFSVVDGEGLVSCHFSPTHSPNPSLAPPGERGELHLAASLKVGNREIQGALASKWPQRRHEALKLASVRRQLASKWPRHIDGLCKSISAQRQQALKRLQQIKEPLNQFDGNAPLRTFFPPLNTRPNVAVSSLSAPAGVERVGERGGIQRIKNKSAADNQFGNSSHDDPRVPKEHQKQELTMHIARGLAIQKMKIIGQYPQIAIQELTA